MLILYLLYLIPYTYQQNCEIVNEQKGMDQKMLLLLGFIFIKICMIIKLEYLLNTFIYSESQNLLYQ